MRKNQARRKLLAGGVICGPSLSYPAVEMVEEALEHDFDYLWIEWQHGGWTETTLSPALAVCVGRESVPIVRLPGFDPMWVGRVLDLGALGIIIPMVETAEECERIVQAAKFPPRGSRSATGLRTSHHADNDFYQYTEQANDEIMVVVMVETPTAIGNVREMMRVPDVDCVLIGPYDLSRSLGASAVTDDIVEDLVEEVASASKDTGVAAGYVTGSYADAERRVKQGFRMVCPGHDITAVRSGFAGMKDTLERLRKLS